MGHAALLQKNSSVMRNHDNATNFSENVTNFSENASRKSEYRYKIIPFPTPERRKAQERRKSAAK